MRTRISLLLVGLLVAWGAHAQRIGEGQVPPPGSVTLVNQVSPVNLEPGDMGRNGNWIFTDVDSRGIRPQHWRDARNTAFTNAFPAAALVSDQAAAWRKLYLPAADVPYLPQGFLDNAYLEIRAGGLYCAGNAIEAGAYTLDNGDRIEYGDQAARFFPEAELVLPFGFGFGDERTAREFKQTFTGRRFRNGAVDSFMVVRTLRKGFVGDGQGSLITPQSANTEVLRLRTTIHEVDSIYFWPENNRDLGVIGYEVARLNPVRYSWFAGESGWELFSLTVDEFTTLEAGFGVDSELPIVYFREFTRSVPENIGVITVPLGLTVPSATPVTVRLVTGDVPPRAFPFIDYQPIDSLLVTFLPGETLKHIEVAILDDSLIEDDERFHVRVFDASANARLGTVNYFVVTIIDDDLPTVTFIEPDMYVHENDGVVRVPIVATNPTNEPVEIHVVSDRRSATPEKDYWPVDTVVRLEAFETITYVELHLVDDLAFEDSVSVVLRLAGASGNANVGFPDTIRVTIVDDDFRPNFKFTRRDTTVPEATNLPFNAVHAHIELAYRHPQLVRIYYRIIDGTATDGEDFIGVGDDTTFVPFIDFLPGEVLKTLAIPIINDTKHEDSEDFTIELLDLTPNAQPALIRQKFHVTITDNDPVSTGVAPPAETLLTLYPNPTHGPLHLTGPDARALEVYNHLGQRVWTQSLPGEVDLSALPDGVYLLRVTSVDGAQRTGRIVLAR